jgi:rhodanese-related sulfurtransferase
MEKNTNNSDHYKISNKLPLIGISALTIIILGILFMNKPNLKYEVSAEEMLEISLNREDVVRPPEFMHIYYSKDTSYRFIDLRPADQYLISHLEGAVNIPLHRLLDDEFKNILNQNEKINVLYYSDQCGACGPWMILKQIGYKNNKLLQGGYDYVRKNIIEEYQPMSGNYSAEKAKYDFAKIIKNTPSSGSDINIGNIPIVVTKKKKEREAGGC